MNSHTRQAADFVGNGIEAIGLGHAGLKCVVTKPVQVETLMHMEPRR
jgi:hypothetical protein